MKNDNSFEITGLTISWAILVWPISFSLTEFLESKFGHVGGGSNIPLPPAMNIAYIPSVLTCILGIAAVNFGVKEKLLAPVIGGIIAIISGGFLCLLTGFGIGLGTII